MRNTCLFILSLAALVSPPRAGAEGIYRLEKVADGVYAALSQNGSVASSNAFFVEGNDFVVAGGAHMTKEAIAELVAAIARTTPKPLRYFILPHHHPGFSHIDFDFPPGIELIMTAETWQSLASEVRKYDGPSLFFSEGLTLKAGPRTIILTNLGPAHSRGDLAVYIPEAGILYAGDLFYNGSVGYLGEGSMRNWVTTLDLLAQLNAPRIIPGYGPTCGNTELDAFRTYFRDFLSKVLEHIERGESLEQTVRTFTLPKYRALDGYERFLKPNVEQAYRELKEQTQP